MLTTVSTVLDTRTNIEAFVRRNLAGGADHVVVFLDGPCDEAAEWLDDHPHVTCVRAYDDWWAGSRPDKLDKRQRINANVGRALVAVLDPGGWVFHVDADEVVQVDRDELAALDDDVEVLWLEPMEAVSQPRPQGPVTLFKRLLDDDDLHLLSLLDVIDEPDNRSYFHGHVIGKSGMRPRLDRWHVLHHVVDSDGTKIRAHRGPWSRVLHYESWSGEEFVRKWTAQLGAGPTKHKKFRKGRLETASALRSLGAKQLPDDVAERCLTQIYERTTRDDVERLAELQLLVEVDPDAGHHRPAALDQPRTVALDAMLTALRPVRKQQFHHDQPAAPVIATMRRVAADVGLTVPAPPTVAAVPTPPRQRKAGRRTVGLLGRGGTGHAARP